MRGIERETTMANKIEITDYALNSIKYLLENYDKELVKKMLNYGDMMSDWADASQSQTVKYAEKYALLRKERQAISLTLVEVNVAIDSRKENDNGNKTSYSGIL